jgi:hypothetical protein
MGASVHRVARLPAGVRHPVAARATRATRQRGTERPEMLLEGGHLSTRMWVSVTTPRLGDWTPAHSSVFGSARRAKSNGQGSAAVGRMGQTEFSPIQRTGI